MCPSNNAIIHRNNDGGESDHSENDQVENPPRNRRNVGEEVLLHAVDDPPPVITHRQNTPPSLVNIRNQTPQHLATLVAPDTWSSGLADPIVLQEKYFLWGLADGKIGVWTCHQLFDGTITAAATATGTSSSSPSRRSYMDNVAPAFMLETNASTPWVQISPFPTATTSNHDPTAPLELLCLTVSGVFFHLKLVENFKNDSSHSADGSKDTTPVMPPVKLEVLKTWNTRRVGASCFYVTPQSNSVIIVGFKNGIVEAYKDQKRRLWSGHFEDYPSIRSILAIDTKAEEYLLFTLEPKDFVATASAIEIINLTKLQNEIGDSAEPSPKSIVLEKYWVFPQAGREVLDAAVLRERYRQATSLRFGTNSNSNNNNNWIPSHGTLVATHLPGGQVMVEVADGSVIFIDAVEHESDQSTKFGDLSWGVTTSTTNGQFLLTYPSIGRGVISIGQAEYAACALRGGTIYLFPLPKTEDADTTPRSEYQIRSCCYPDDISRDAPMQHLQAFTAGNMKVGLPAHENATGFPLLFFCWPGGIVDVYCAHLLPSAVEDTAHLWPFIESGIADDLRRLLHSLSNDPDNLLRDAVWVDARTEVSTFPSTSSSITLEDLESNRLLNFRKLLRQLANAEHELPESQGTAQTNVSGAVYREPGDS